MASTNQKHQLCDVSATLKQPELSTEESSSSSAGKDGLHSSVSAAVAASGTCLACAQPLRGLPFVSTQRGPWHLECFRCVDCGQIVRNKFFTADSANAPFPSNVASPSLPASAPSATAPIILCERDYFRRLDLLCAVCHQPLRSQHVKALGRKYHLEHFTCSLCPATFGPNDTYYERSGKVYCETHFGQLFASRCGGCGAAVLKNFVEVTRKPRRTQSDPQHEDAVRRTEAWHPECYMIYKLWNIRLASTRVEDGPEDGNPAVTAKDTYAKACSIFGVLSTFEESSASCMTEMLIHFSNQHYSDGIVQASKFIAHIEVLFASIDYIESQLSQHSDRTGLRHTKEPKQLAKKIVQFFSLLSHTKGGNVPRSETTKDLISLVTALAHTLKILIRAALSGALKLERNYGLATAISSFLDRLNALSSAPNTFRIRIHDVKTDLCPRCRQSVEENCIRAEAPSALRWHKACFSCLNCSRNLYESARDAVLTDNKIYCLNCSKRANVSLETMTPFEYVTQLEQYHFLLRCALKRLCGLLGVRADTWTTNEAEDVSEQLRRTTIKELRVSELTSTRSDSRQGRSQTRSPEDVPRLERRHLSVDDPSSYRRNRAKSYSGPMGGSSVDNNRTFELDSLSEAGPSAGVLESNVAPELSDEEEDDAIMERRDSIVIHRRMHSLTKSTAPSRSPDTPKSSSGIGASQLDVAVSARSRPSGVGLASSSIEENLTHTALRSDQPIPISIYQQHPASIRQPSLPSTLPPSSSPSMPPLTTSTSSADNVLQTQRVTWTSQPRENARYLSELSALEEFIVRQTAVVYLQPLLSEFFRLEEVLDIVETKKSIWDKLVAGFKGSKKSKVKEGVFGVPLEVLAERSSVDTEQCLSPGQVRIPSVIENIIQYINSTDLTIEGIYRKNGNIRRLKEVAEEMDHASAITDKVVIPDEGSIQTAAFLKKFLREMPEPLLTFKLCTLFWHAQRLRKREDRLLATHLILCLLPKPHRDTLEVLLVHLRDVASHSDTNKMDIDNLAVVIAPNILYAKSKGGTMDEPANMSVSVAVVKMLLEHVEDFVEVPTCLLDEMRNGSKGYEAFGGRGAASHSSSTIAFDERFASTMKKSHSDERLLRDT